VTNFGSTGNDEIAAKGRV
jgi:hypothetical protein